MPDFTIIDGGGEKRDWDAVMAQQHFRSLVVELLRSVARGDDPTFRIVGHLNNFIEAARKAQRSAGPIINDAIGDVYRELNDGDASYEEERRRIVIASLRVAAETAAQDGFAKGRLSSRETDLQRSIEHHMRGSEERSRD